MQRIPDARKGTARWMAASMRKPRCKAGLRLRRCTGKEGVRTL